MERKSIVFGRWRTEESFVLSNCCKICRFLRLILKTIGAIATCYWRGFRNCRRSDLGENWIPSREFRQTERVSAGIVISIVIVAYLSSSQSSESVTKQCTIPSPVKVSRTNPRISGKVNRRCMTAGSSCFISLEAKCQTVTENRGCFVPPLLIGSNFRCVERIGF